MRHTFHRAAVLRDGPAALPLSGRADGTEAVHRAAGRTWQRLNDTLSKQGFRRSQNVLYRPSCAECSACLSARIRVADFQPNRSRSAS